MQEISPSKIALNAIGRAPMAGYPAATAGRCAFCGVSHKPRQPVMPFEPKNSFTDWAALADTASRTVCVWCAGLMSDKHVNRQFMQTWMNTVMCSQGVFQAASNDHLTYWFLNPPAGQWLFMQGDQMLQHLVWRAPVNRSRDFYQIRHGERVLTIRRHHLAEGRDAAIRLTSAMNVARRIDGKRGAPYRSPFATLSRKLDHIRQGALNPALDALSAADPAIRADEQKLRSLTAGERWALTAVLFAKNPQRPKALVSPST